MNYLNSSSNLSFFLHISKSILGTSPHKQISGIFEIIGTPDEISWPSIKYDKGFRSLNIPAYPGRDLKTLVPRLEDKGIDILRSFLKCNPSYRISAQDAMSHQYFDDLPKAIHSLPDNMSIFSVPSIKLSEELSKQPRLEHNV